MSLFHLPVHIESKASIGWCSVHPDIVRNCSVAGLIQLQHMQCYLQCHMCISCNCHQLCKRRTKFKIQNTQPVHFDSLVTPLQLILIHMVNFDIRQFEFYSLCPVFEAHISFSHSLTTQK